MLILDELIAALPETHRRALQWFAAHANTEQPWTSSLDDELFLVTKAKGIYKPAWSEYALSVRQVLNGPYPDQDPIVRADGTWVYQYYQEGNNPDEQDKYYTNRALMACWRDSVPVGVLRQTKGKPKVRYFVLGLALVAGWDNGYFFFEGFAPSGVNYGKGTNAQITMITEQFSVSNESAPELTFDGTLDSRRKVIASVIQRQGQKQFRERLLVAYLQQCAISRSNVIQTLEAAHIYPYRGIESNQVSNGLLLRADLHILFDLGLIAVDSSNMTVIISASLKETMYEAFDGALLHLPSQPYDLPSKKMLDHHRLWAGL